MMFLKKLFSKRRMSRYQQINMPYLVWLSKDSDGPRWRFKRENEPDSMARKAAELYTKEWEVYKEQPLTLRCAHLYDQPIRGTDSVCPPNGPVHFTTVGCEVLHLTPEGELSSILPSRE